MIKKRMILLGLLLLTMVGIAHAVLKERDLSQTLSILRSELEKVHYEQERHVERAQRQQERTRRDFMETIARSNQNALMLYSQKPDYVFDLTYACHEATEQFRSFKQKSSPFKEYIGRIDSEIARYDSLIVSLQHMRMSTLSAQAQTDRNVCLTLATNIRHSLSDGKDALNEYIESYAWMERHLKHLNDYANVRYNEIQNNIFINGGANYLSILKSLPYYLSSTAETVNEKYGVRGFRYGVRAARVHSQWDVKIILQLFLYIILYGIVAGLLNLLLFRLLRRSSRLQNEGFLQKRACIIMATTTITFAVILAVVRALAQQHFIIMASELLIEYAWLLGVILISLLLRIDGSQIKSAFSIYAPLIVMGFVVIAFRIILIPNDLVNLCFPPMLLACTCWQWWAVRRHNDRIPRSDMMYTYMSLVIFVASTVCSWVGYTLLSVQLLIWWIMQLTCILTITCIITWMKKYNERKHLDEKPITKTWFFKLLYSVVLPWLGLMSIPLSIYMAADVFNLSDLTWKIFNQPFIDVSHFRMSIFSIIQVITLYFIFRYINQLLLQLMQLHFNQKNMVNAGSRKMMGKNVIQVIVWGAWLLLSLSILRIGGTWLGYIAGGLSTGIGFASKDILENIYYGISLMTGRVKVGDWIECDGTKGKVASISYTSTMLEAIDGSVIAFTNSQLFTKNYKNLTKNHGYVLSIIPFGVAYGSNLKDVTKLVENSVKALRHRYIDNRKDVRVVFTEFGDSSINFKLLCWVDAVKQIYAVSDVMECIYDTLNANGIEIPFPQRDVHIKSEQ